MPVSPLPLLALLLGGCPTHERTPSPPPPVPVAAERETVHRLVLDQPSHALPEGAPAAILRVAPGTPLEDAPLVVYLHGWEGCAEAVLAAGPSVPCRPGGALQPGWGLAELVDRSGLPVVLVVPQLAFLARSSSAGRFAEADFSRAWLARVQAELQTTSGVRSGPVVLAAHSGGYRTLQALLQAELDGVIAAVFLDGLYGGAEGVADWVVAAPDRRAVTLHTANRDTTSQSRLLVRRVAERLGADAVAVDPPDLPAAAREHRAVSARTQVAHGAVPEAHLAELLAALLR